MTTKTQLGIFDQLKDALRNKIPVATVTVVRGEPLGAKLLVLPDRTEGTVGTEYLDEIAAADAKVLLDAERSETRTYSVPGSDTTVDLFIETFPQPPTLLIFGAVHVAQALTRFAKILGFNVIVSDARAKLATEERFPEADQIIQAWPDDALRALKIDGNTYVAILTHDPKFDEPALLGTIETNARYIGAVGSRKTNRDRRQRLIDAGMREQNLERVRGPIGLNIGAESPEEMAISILAEIIAIRHGRPGGPLTEATGNIRGDRES
jgi:xanthine dehydrogenase accessory factor